MNFIGDISAWRWAQLISPNDGRENLRGIDES